MISRETKIEQSVELYLKEQLFEARDVDPDQVAVRDAYNRDTFEAEYDEHGLPTKNFIAPGFNFDNGGVQAECGSDLKRRSYTIEFFVLGITPLWGQNLAGLIAESLDNDGRIPLRDIGEDGQPIIDYLVVDEVSTERGEVADPQPWERHLWVTRLKVTDEYFARLAP